MTLTVHIIDVSLSGTSLRAAAAFSCGCGLVRTEAGHCQLVVNVTISRVHRLGGVLCNSSVKVPLTRRVEYRVQTQDMDVGVLQPGQYSALRPTALTS